MSGNCFLITAKFLKQPWFCMEPANGSANGKNMITVRLWRKQCSGIWMRKRMPDFCRMNSKPATNLVFSHWYLEETNPFSMLFQVSGGSGETALSETVNHIQTIFQNLDKEDFRFLTAASFCPHAAFATTIHAIKMAATSLRPLFLSLLFEAAFKQVTTKSDQNANHRGSRPAPATKPRKRFPLNELPWWTNSWEQ